VRLNRSWTRESFQYGWIKVNIAIKYLYLYICTIYIHKCFILNDIVDYLKKGIFGKYVSIKIVWSKGR